MQNIYQMNENFKHEMNGKATAKSKFATFKFEVLAFSVLVILSCIAIAND